MKGGAVRQKQLLKIPVLAGRGSWQYKGKLILSTDSIVFDGGTLTGRKKFTFSIPREDITGIDISAYPLHALPPHLRITYKDRRENYPKMSLFEMEKSISYDPFFPIWKDNETRLAVFTPGWRWDRRYIKAAFQSLKQTVNEKLSEDETLVLLQKLPPYRSGIFSQAYFFLMFIPLYSITFLMGLVPAILFGASDIVAVLAGLIGGFLLAWVFCDAVFYSKLDQRVS